MNRTNLVLCCALAMRTSVVFLALSVHAHATTVVYDSLSGYSPEYMPGTAPWLNGDVEQGILISRSSVDQHLIKAEFLLRSDFFESFTTSTTMRFYSDQNGLPAALLATVVDSIPVSARSVKQISVDLPSIFLPVDPIWVTWSFGFGSNGFGVQLGATTTIGNDYGDRVYREGGSWNTDIAFDLHGVPALRLTAVPEPSTSALGCCALALLAVGRGIRSLPTRLGGG